MWAFFRAEDFAEYLQDIAVVLLNASDHRKLLKAFRSMTQLRLTVNGTSYSLEFDDDSMPLLWALRDVIGLTGTKYGCGMAQCGACTVHVDGKATRSCVLPVSAAAGKAITTIEGLSTDGRHPLQLAWQEMDVPQCGYCQAGQIMNAAALLKEHSAPTDEEITRAMSGNICRCGTYARIHRAIKKAATLNEPAHS